MQKQQITFDSSLISAFGTLETNELIPVLQGDFVYGLNTQVWNTPITSGTSALVDTNLGRLRIQCGTDTNGYAYITSKKIIRYRAGSGTVARFTPVFTTGTTSNYEYWGVGSIVSNLPYDGYFVGYNGTAFGIAYYNGGVLNWIPQNSTTVNSWNGNKCDGSLGAVFTWNPAYGTPVMIKYPYLGYGDVKFFVQNPEDGSWVLFHTIRYANTSASTELSNPSLQFIGYTLNSGGTTNKTMYCGSIGMFISGVRNFASNPKYAMDSNKATVTTEVCLMNIKNCTTYNGTLNRGSLRINSISFASNNNSISTLMLKIGATIGGTPSYTTINGTSADNGTTITSGNSIASYDVAGTTVTGGMYIYNLTIGQGSNISLDISELDISIQPGEILTISAKSSAAATVGCSINWTENI